MDVESASSLIFISYARPDYDKALRLYNQLKKAGLDVWLDKESILPGQNWDDEIRRAINKSRFFVPLLSSNSVSKIGYVQRELKNALEKQEEFPEPHTYLIPARLDECNINDFRLSKIQFVDLFSDWNKGIEKMLEAMKAGNSGEATSNLNNIKFTLENSLVDLETKKLSPQKYYTQFEKLNEWYKTKAHCEKSRFNLCQVVIIMTGIIIAVIPVMILTLGGIGSIAGAYAVSSTISILGMVIYFSTAISQVHAYEEKWIHSSTISEAFNNEKNFFDNNVGSYAGLNDDEKQKLLVERAQFIIQDELSGNFRIE